MKRALTGLLFIAAVTAATIFAQDAVRLRELQGNKPYIPSRLEWLAVELNAYSRYDNLGGDGFTITYVAVEKDDTILLCVRYMRNVNREAMNISVDAARRVFSIRVKSKGWDSWVQLKEQIEMAN